MRTADRHVSSYTLFLFFSILLFLFFSSTFEIIFIGKHMQKIIKEIWQYIFIFALDIFILVENT